MAEIALQDVQLSRTRLRDFGSVSPDGMRVYMLKYPIPGVPGMEEQIHIMPLPALVNHRLDTSQEDPMLSMQALLQEYMSMHQTVVAMGQVKAQTDESSPLVKSALAVQDLHVKLDTGAQALASTVPMSSIEDAHASVQDAFIANATPPALAKMKSGVSQFKNCVTYVQEARTDYSDIVTPVQTEHTVDTSLKAWDTLTQMVADDTDEYTKEQAAWFDHRFGRNIKYIAGQRLMEAGIKA